MPNLPRTGCRARANNDRGRIFRTFPPLGDIRTVQLGEGAVFDIPLNKGGIVSQKQEAEMEQFHNVSVRATHEDNR